MKLSKPAVDVGGVAVVGLPQMGQLPATKAKCGTNREEIRGRLIDDIDALCCALYTYHVACGFRRAISPQRDKRERERDAACVGCAVPCHGHAKVGCRRCCSKPSRRPSRGVARPT